MAAQTLTQDKDSFRIVSERNLAPNIQKIVHAYPELEQVKTFTQFKIWQKTHAELPLALWHYLSTSRPRVVISRPTQTPEPQPVTAMPQDPPTVSSAIGMPEPTLPVEGTTPPSPQLSTDDFTHPSSQSFTETASSIAMPTEPANVPIEIPKPLVGDLRNREISSGIVTPRETPIDDAKERENIKRYTALTQQTLPQSLHVANKYLLPRLSREAYERRLQKKEYLRFVPIIHMVKNEPPAGAPSNVPVRRVVPQEQEYSFTLPVTRAETILHKEYVEGSKENLLFKKAGIFSSRTEPDSTDNKPYAPVTGSPAFPIPENIILPHEQSTVPPVLLDSLFSKHDIQDDPKIQDVPKIQVLSLKDVLLKERRPELTLTVEPSDADEVRHSATSDPVYRLFQETGFAAALITYEQTGNQDDYIDQILAWQHAYAANNIEQAESYRHDDDVLDAMTREPYSPLAPIFSGRENEEIPSFTPSALPDYMPEESDQQSSYDSSSPDSQESHEPHESHSPSTRNIKRLAKGENPFDMVGKRAAGEAGKDLTQMAARIAAQNAARAAGAAIADAAGGAAAGTIEIWGPIALILLLIILVILMIFLFLSGGSEQEKQQTTLDVPVTIEKTGDKEVPNDTDIHYTIHASAPSPATGITVHDPIPVGTEFKNATGNYTLEKDASGKVIGVAWNLTPTSGTEGGVDESPTLTLHATKQDTYIINEATATGIGASAVIPVTIEKVQDPQQEQNGVGINQTAKYKFAVSYPGQADDIVVNDRLSDGVSVVASGTTSGYAYDPATNTVSWHIKDVLANSHNSIASDPLAAVPPVSDVNAGIKDVNTSLTLVVQSKNNDTYIFDQATAIVVGAKKLDTGASNGTGSTGTVAVPSGIVPATTDDCKGKYTSYMKKKGIQNYGDPKCNFTKDELHALIMQQDPDHIHEWFDIIIPGESTFLPIAHSSQAEIGSPDPAGTWGLFQMGQGRNGQYDHGDVDWANQVVNAVTYNKKLGSSIFCYWDTARKGGIAHNCK